MRAITAISGLLLIFVLTLLSELPYVFLALPLIPFVVYFFIVKRESKSIAGLSAMGFFPTKSVELFYGRSIHLDSGSRRVAFIDGKTVLVAAFDEAPELIRIGTSLGNEKQVTAVSFEVSFKEKATGYWRKMGFYDVPIKIFQEIECIWPR